MCILFKTTQLDSKKLCKTDANIRQAFYMQNSAQMQPMLLNFDKYKEKI